MPVRKISKTFVDSKTFNNATTTYTSDSFNVSEYTKFALLINKTVSSTPTDIKIQVEVSDDNVTFYELENDFWGDLRYEDTAGTQTEAIMDDCPFIYMRIVVTATGTDASKTFTLTVKGMFMV